MFFTNGVLPWLFCILLEYRCVSFLLFIDLFFIFICYMILNAPFLGGYFS